MDAADFRRFTFTNAVSLYTGTRPDFFAGTDVETAVKDELDGLSNTLTCPARNLRGGYTMVWPVTLVSPSPTFTVKPGKKNMGSSVLVPIDWPTKDSVRRPINWG